MKIRPTHCIVFVVILAAVLMLPVGALGQVADDDPGWLDSLAIDSPVSVVIFMDGESARTGVARVQARTGLSRGDRVAGIIRELRATQPRGIEEARAYINESSTTVPREFWIVSAFSATLRPAQIRQLMTFDGVARIIPDVALISYEPVRVAPASTAQATVSSQLQLLDVPALWAMGLNGSGRLVCSFDTGVDGDHPALASKWRGTHASLSESWFSAISPTSPPSDRKGHGTHTMGVMVGSTAADTFGVAPAAEWISAGVIDQGKSLSSTISDIIAAFQWALNPDGNVATSDDVPDVILNSWGIPAGIFSDCDATFWGVVDNVEAAGIVTVFAAGNEGPDAKTLRQPADRATSPLNTLAVGAVDNSKVIAEFSSRGPSRCDPSQVKPEVVAPGVSIRSSYADDTYKLMSGTSMAAPYIAGLVALARQYNPNATVEEIKTAIINSAEDLGTAGEDNAYGHGLVNAERMLQHLPRPAAPKVAISGASLTNTEVALPGEEVDLTVTLTNLSANLERAYGRLIASPAGDISIVVGTAEYYFGDGGSVASNSPSFRLYVDPDAIHGTPDTLQMELTDEFGEPFDTLPVPVTVGYPAPGDVVAHAADRLNLAISNFGQYGLAAGSIYNLDAAGMTFDGSANLLYEAGLIVGRSSLQLSSAIRDETGKLRPSDFTPTQSISPEILDLDGGLHRVTRMNDANADVTIPVEIRQETIDFSDVGEAGSIIFRFTVSNSSLERITGVHLGWLADFDLGPDEEVLFDPTLQLLYQRSSDGPMVGLIALENMSTFVGLDNGAGKRGFSKTEQYDLISSGTVYHPDGTGDMVLLIGSDQFTLAAHDSARVGFALVAGASEQELFEHAANARRRYDVATSVDDNPAIPSSFVLHQNYPNPFNPTTTIDFSIDVAADVSLTVYNVLGQRVRVLIDGQMPAGDHSIVWDARDETGSQAATGVYFYRLETADFSASRKMILLR